MSITSNSGYRFGTEFAMVNIKLRPRLPKALLVQLDGLGRLLAGATEVWFYSTSEILLPTINIFLPTSPEVLLSPRSRICWSDTVESNSLKNTSCGLVGSKISSRLQAYKMC